MTDVCIFLPFDPHPRVWVVNVGQATSRVALDGTEPALRHFHTLNVGPEMGLGGGEGEGLWEVSQFDVWAPSMSD